MLLLLLLMMMMMMMSVSVPPRIDESLVSNSNLSVFIDRSMAIDCPVTGTPQPDIIWFKDGRQLSTNQNDDIRVVSRGQRLEVNNADLDDAGRYKCVAKNAAGFVDRNFQLHVWGQLRHVAFYLVLIVVSVLRVKGQCLHDVTQESGYE